MVVGRKPAFTKEKRQAIADAVTKRDELFVRIKALCDQIRELRAERVRLRLEVKAMPTRTQLAKQLGVTTVTVRNACNKFYKNQHPQDAAKAPQP